LDALLTIRETGISPNVSKQLAAYLAVEGKNPTRGGHQHAVMHYASV